MSTRTFQFFIILSEFLEIIESLVQSLQLRVILYRQLTKPQAFFIEDKTLTINKIENLKIDVIFLAKDELDLSVIDQRRFSPGKLGWIQVELPKESNNVLYMSDIGVKTDWYDAENKIIYENKELLPLYNRFASRLRKKFKYPVGLYNIDNPKKIFLCRGIGFTEAVREFEKNGGELMQHGVLKQRFTTLGPEQNE